MRVYFEASGWAWWDALTGESPEVQRYPGALAQYATKSLAEAVRRADADDVPFSPENLAELYRQTRHLAMNRPVGAFRTWKGELERKGQVVIEDDKGQIVVRPRRRISTLARLRDRLFTNTGARLLCLVLHDFGDGTMRPAMRVRGREDISFKEISDTYELNDAVLAARRALSIQGSTAIPESPSQGIPNEPGNPPGRPSSVVRLACDAHFEVPW
jgi:hypothetical protein